MRESGLEQKYRELILEHLDRLPARQELLVQAALARYSERNQEKAADLYETLIARFPDEVDAYSGLAQLRRDSALTILERGVKAVPHSGPLRNEYGFALFALGRYPEALRELETYVRLDPDEPNAHDSLAHAYLSTGQPEKALQHYARALEINSSFVNPFRGRAYAYGMLGRYDEALAEADEMRAFATRENMLRTSMEIQYFTGFLLSRAGRYREAEELIETSGELAARIAPGGRHASIKLLSALPALERGLYSKVVEITSGALGIFQKEESIGGTVLTHLLVGVARARAGNLEAAQTELESMRKVYRPGNEWDRRWSHALEGEIALAAGDLDSAEVAFYAGEPKLKEYVNFYPYGICANALPSRDGLARVKKARGDLDGAIDIYRELNIPGMSNKWTGALEPRYVLEVARLLDQKGDTGGARLEYQRFRELWKDADPGLPELDEARRYLKN
jgi:tetratricopeptide (TPR) repeat protein